MIREGGAQVMAKRVNRLRPDNHLLRNPPFVVLRSEHEGWRRVHADASGFRGVSPDLLLGWAVCALGQPFHVQPDTGRLA